MFKVIKWIFIFSLFVLPFSIQASVYALQYDKNSPIKSVSLNNTIVKIKIFLGGTPQGIYDVITNSHGYFTTFDTAKARLKSVRVIAIRGQKQQQAICQGISGKANNLILITCRSAPKIT